jgi:ribonuclease BN (tRNA processing enzyme)
MQITMLGTGAAIVRKERRSPAVLIQADNQSILVDCGWGVLGALMELGFPLHTLDHVCITHQHADHIVMLPALIQSMHVAGIPHYPGERRVKKLNLHGFPGFGKEFRTLIDMMAPDLGETFCMPIVEYPQASNYCKGSLVITAAEVRHVPEHFPAVSFRFQNGGKSVVVSGDLGWDNRFAALLEGADLAVIEAAVSPEQYAREGPRSNHLSAFECGKMAKQAGVGHLVLTHLYEVDHQAVVADVRKNFSGELTIPEDLQSFRV